jgi:hypothetical protein
MAVILATDFGPHPPGTWAQAAADQICPIDPSLMGDQRTKAEQLRAAIAGALVPLFSRIQDDERQKLTSDPEHILIDHDAVDVTDDAVIAIQQAADGGEWSGHYQRGDVVDAVKFEIMRLFITAQHTERLWHADRNPDNEQAQAYKRKYNPPEETQSESIISPSSMDPLSLNQQ